MKNCCRYQGRSAWRGICAGLLVLAMVFAGCDSGEVQRRADEIRERNAQSARLSSAMAVRKVRERWLVRDGKWFGMHDDGSFVRLDSPNVGVTPIKNGRPYCCRWLGEITISAERWRTERPVDTTLPFALTYTVLVQDSARIEVMETSGPDVSQPSPAEISALAAAQ
jgi:hypothetical protein